MGKHVLVAYMLDGRCRTSLRDPSQFGSSQCSRKGDAAQRESEEAIILMS